MLNENFIKENEASSDSLVWALETVTGKLMPLQKS